MSKTKTIFLEIFIETITAGILALPAFYGFYILMSWLVTGSCPIQELARVYSWL